MSGPWEDFQTQPAAPAPPAPAQAEAGPWQDFAAPATPAPAEEGLSFTVTDDRPDYGVPLPKSRGELQQNLRRMTEMGQPLESIRSYIDEAGYQLEDEELRRLSESYTPGQALDWEASEPVEEDIGVGDAAWEGVKSGALRGWGDEWQGFWGATGNKIGTALGLNESTADFWDIYRQLQQENEQYRDRAFDEHPLAYGAGFLPGMLTGPSFVRAAKGPAGGGRFARARQAATIGGIEGAISGGGNAAPGETLEGSLLGGTIGAVAAPLVAPLADRGIQAISSLFSRLAPRSEGNALNSALEVINRRAPQTAEDLTARAEQFRSGGVEPRLVDIVDESGRGVIRDASGKMTPAREDVVRHADTVYEDAQDRVAEQARRNITTDPRTARQVSELIAEEQQALGPRFEAVRNNPVEVTPEIAQAFSTAEGQNVLRAIGRLMTPDERDALTKFQRAIVQASRQGTPEEQAEKLVPGFAGMSPAAQQQVISQLDLQDPLANAPLTVDIADKFARIITNRAKQEPALMRVASQYADATRGAARQQYPEYDAALNDFAAAARVGDAAAGTGRFADTEFLRTPPDQYRPLDASAEPAAVRTGGDVDAELTPEMLDAVRAHTAGDEMFAEAVNAYLRNPDGFNGIYGVSREAVENYLTNVKAFVDNSALASPTKLHRGFVATEPGGLDRQIEQGFIELPKPASFTSDEAVARGYHDVDPFLTGDPEFDDVMQGVRLTLDAPQGARVGSADEISGDDLKEYVLAGVDRLPIKSTYIADDGTRVIELDGSQLPVRRPAQPTMSEQDALRLRARDDVVDKATSGSGAQAMGVARQISRGSAQRRRNENLLGEEGARRFEQGMRSEVERVDNTRFIDPRVGSQTASRQQDAMEGFDDLVEAGGHAVMGNKTGMIYAARRWLRQNSIRGVDAERLVREAISDDPATVNNLIEFLGRRGVETQRARSLVRAISAGMAGRAVGALSARPQERQEKPRPSIRAIYNQSASRPREGEN